MAKIKDTIKRIIRVLTPQKLINIYTEPYLKPYRYVTLSYSQEGEDLILARIFANKKKGFYVDVGAHHPERFSNTNYFYQLGWNGINIDAMPGSMDAFKIHRKNDINLEIPISEKPEKLIYYGFNEPALNTFSKLVAEEYTNLSNYKIVFQKEMETQPLSKVLEQYLPPQKTIDFMSIDVEGLDINVLRSNDWTKYRPLILLVEDLNKLSIFQLELNDVNKYLTSVKYELFAKTLNTLFFRDLQNSDYCK